MGRTRKFLAAAAALWAATGMLAELPAHAQQGVTLTIAVRNQRFEPARIEAPANRPITLRVKNLDAAAIEFESVSLRVEKVVPPGGEGLLHIRALAPGSYEFFDDFHQQTRGTLTVR